MSLTGNKLARQNPAARSNPSQGSNAAGLAGHGAFESTVLVHLDAAYTLARYLTRRGDAAEDIVQEALLRAYRSFGTQRGDNVRAWLLAIVRNCFLTWKTRNGYTEPLTEDGGETGGEGEIEETNPEKILIQNEESGAIRSLVEGLPNIFREVLVLRDIEDLSYREISEVTGVPMGTVMSRLARARKMFAAAWKEREGISAQKVLP